MVNKLCIYTHAGAQARPKPGPACLYSVVINVGGFKIFARVTGAFL